MTIPCGLRSCAAAWDIYYLIPPYRPPPRLPCNSSIDAYPQNTIAHYTTKLSTPIRLDNVDAWEVGLSEFQYPHTWNNIGDESNQFEIMTRLIDPNRGTTCTLKKRYYKSVQELVTAMNDVIQIELGDYPRKNEFVLDYDPQTKKINFHIPTGDSLKFKKPLSHILGYHKDYVDLGNLTHDVNVTSPFQTDLNGYFRNMYVYCDVIQYTSVGDVSAPVLRTILTDGQEGAHVHKSFDNVHYFPVSKTYFESIEIDIRNDTGAVMPFESGRVYAVLHFKRRK